MVVITRRSLFSIIASLPIWARLGFGQSRPPVAAIPQVVTPTNILEDVLPQINSALDILLEMYKLTEYPVAIPRIDERFDDLQESVSYRMETYWAIDPVKVQQLHARVNHYLSDGISNSSERTALALAGQM